MSEDDLKQREESEAAPIIKNPEIEVLPPIMREVPQTREHQKDEQLALQIRDMGRLGLSKSSTALAARITPYLLDKYYSEEFLEGQSQMQKGLNHGNPFRLPRCYCNRSYALPRGFALL